MPIYLIQNAPMQTIAAPAGVATGTSIKTLLQLKPIVPIKILEWGISFDGFAAAAPGKVELIETDVTCTVTAFADADFTKIRPVSDAPAASTYLTLSTSGSGYTSTSEGSTTAVRNLDATQFMAPTTQYNKQLPLGMEPLVQANKFLRIRVTFATSVNALCYVKFET